MVIMVDEDYALVVEEPGEAKVVEEPGGVTVVEEPGGATVVDELRKLVTKQEDFRGGAEDEGATRR